MFLKKQSRGRINRVDNLCLMQIFALHSQYVAARALGLVCDKIIAKAVCLLEINAGLFTFIINAFESIFSWDTSSLPALDYLWLRYQI